MAGRSTTSQPSTDRPEFNHHQGKEGTGDPLIRDAGIFTVVLFAASGESGIAGIVALAVLLFAFLFIGWLLARASASAPLKAEMPKVDEASIRVDEAGVVLDANEEALRLFGYKRSEVLGRDINTLMPGSYKASQANAGGDVFGKKRNGETFPMRLSWSELLSADATERTFVGTCKDVSTEKWREAKALNDELAAKLAKLGGTDAGTIG